jgi:mannose/fructose-specific phosphotransferase system component IIA
LKRTKANKLLKEQDHQVAAMVTGMQLDLVLFAVGIKMMTAELTELEMQFSATEGILFTLRIWN